MGEKMKPEIKAWLEKVTERAAIITQDDDSPVNVLRGTYYCSLVNWDIDKIKELAEHLRAYGETEDTIEDMRAAWRMWKT